MATEKNRWKKKEPIRKICGLYLGTLRIVYEQEHRTSHTITQKKNYYIIRFWRIFFVLHLNLVFKNDKIVFNQCTMIAHFIYTSFIDQKYVIQFRLNCNLDAWRMVSFLFISFWNFYLIIIEIPKGTNIYLAWCKSNYNFMMNFARISYCDSKNYL